MATNGTSGRADGIELVLNGANHRLRGLRVGAAKQPDSIGLDRQMIALFVIVLAAPEAAVAAHRVTAHTTVDVDQGKN
jgi:NADH-quinone oxidoreductase subunit K